MAPQLENHPPHHPLFPVTIHSVATECCPGFKMHPRVALAYETLSEILVAYPAFPEEYAKAVGNEGFVAFVMREYERVAANDTATPWFTLKCVRDLQEYFATDAALMLRQEASCIRAATSRRSVEDKIKAFAAKFCSMPMHLIPVIIAGNECGAIYADILNLKTKSASLTPRYVAEEETIAA